MPYPPMTCEKCENCGYTIFECDCDEEARLRDRIILSFGDVKICLLELEERIEQLEIQRRRRGE
jgi:hypothetical protein